MNGHSNDIVISGISGRFPESDSIEEFKKNLFDGVDMVTENSRRWPPGVYGTPTRSGKLKNLHNFDATFFGVDAKHAEVMDPQVRMLLEIAYEAIVDAGVNPIDVRGSRTGVFIATSGSEADVYGKRDTDDISRHQLLGFARAMFANRLSYTFDFKGPSYNIDTGCSSSLYALQQAYVAIQTGQCDAAIVGGSSLCLDPFRSKQFLHLGMLSPQGKCRSFDSSGDGYVRSEASAVIFLQKSGDAKRIYASILGAKTNVDGYKERGITYPSGKMHTKLIKEVYEENNINPHDVAYVETHGTGTKAGDPEEVNSIADVFCENRKNPLLIGGVKSNMGHSETASAVCGLAKVVIAIETGLIPANLHFNTPNEDIPGLHDGRLKVVSKHEEFVDGLIGINSFGFGGANAHVILKPNPKRKQLYSKSSIPRVIRVSGCTKDSVEHFLKEAVKYQDNLEFLALLDEIHSSNIDGHLYRGYTVLTDPLVTEVSQAQCDKRPIWFVYSGMESTKWSGMANDLMKVDVFRKSIGKSANAVKSLGLNLEEILLNGKGFQLNNVLNYIVAITAMQVALTDLLILLEIEPDGIIGHSTGCGYADGTLTTEQAILTAYAMGRAVLNSKLFPGLMASVGLSFEEAKIRCPAEIEISCHNSGDNVTISGPPDVVRKFLGQLTTENIFTKEVDVYGFAFHSRYVADASTNLRKFLDKIIPCPEPRGSRWLSSSVPESGWTKPLAKLCSAEYFSNNFLSPVLFNEAMQQVPENAITIEITPNALMQTILKGCQAPKGIHLNLLNEEISNNADVLMSNIGKLYIAGAQPKLHKLYPTVRFPVGRGTPSIASMVKWDHSVEWGVTDFSEKKFRTGERIVNIDINKEENKFLLGHFIDGRVLYPATGYLTLIWQTFARMWNDDYERMPVMFENVEIHRPTIMPREGSVKFLVNVHEGSGDFELCEGRTVVVSGRIFVPKKVDAEKLILPLPEVPERPGGLPLVSSDIYKLLKLAGYGYRGLFRGILEVDTWGITGKLKWDKNWVTYMDTMLQVLIIGQDKGGLHVPTRLKTLVIDPQEHLKQVNDIPEGQGVPVYVNHDISVIRSGGIEFRGMQCSSAPRNLKLEQQPQLEKYQFVPYENDKYLADDAEASRRDALTVLTHIVHENHINSTKLKVTEVISDRPIDTILLPKIKTILEKEPMVFVDACVVLTQADDTDSLKDDDINIVVKDLTSTDIDGNCHLFVLINVPDNNKPEILANVSASLVPGGFVLVEGGGESFENNLLARSEMTVVAVQNCHTNTFALLRKPMALPTDPIIIQITDKNFSWMESLKAAMKKSEIDGVKIYAYTHEEKTTGLIGMVNCLREEPGGENLRSFYILDSEALTFTINNYQEQVRKDLIHNVWKNGVWGSYRHLLLDTSKESRVHQTKYAYIDITPGDLSSLAWIQQPLADYQGKESALCSIYYAALNYRDIILATGKLSKTDIPTLNNIEDCILGFEFSGRDAEGKRIMGALTAKGLATSVLPSQDLLWQVPDHWTLEEAATVPIAYFTAYYALIMRGRMKPGESILIHAGTGAVGQAAITLAVHMRCTVFTTVSTQAKRDFLKKTFPEILNENIGYSRDTSFEQLVLSRTGGRGVDLVLNSLAGEQLQASVRCLALDGRFLEIGKVDLVKNSPLEMSFFNKNLSFYGVQLDTVLVSDKNTLLEIASLVREGIAQGVVRPLPFTVYNEDQVEEAFRFLGSGKHIGKVIIKIREEEHSKIHTPAPKVIPAISRTYMHPDKSYIIVGGLGGFGIELTKWLILRGARKIILVSRSGIQTGYQSLWVRRWRESGVCVRISTVDITSEEDVTHLLQEANELEPVGGIFNVAVVLRDALFENQTEENFRTVCTAKVDGSKCLDKVSRRIVPQLDHFVCFSSLTSGRGNEGQSNYGFANSTMERLCEARREAGLPGLAIQWGGIADVGLFAEGMNNSEGKKIKNTIPQKMSSCLDALDIFMQQNHPVVGSLVLAKERIDVLGSECNLVNTVANILGIKDMNTIVNTMTLTELGMDSIMGAEIKQSIERDFNLVMNVKQIRNLTFQHLSELSNGSSTSTSDKVLTPLNKTWIKETTSSRVLIQMQSNSTDTNSPVFFLHPLEGHLSSLEPVVANIESPVYGFQYTEDTSHDSITDLANYYVKHLKNVQQQGPYKLVGYSFGGSLALKMALQLHESEDDVNIVLINGYPPCLDALYATHRNIDDLSETFEKETAECLTSFISYFIDINKNQVSSELLELKNLDAMLERTTEILAEKTEYRKNLIKMAANQFYENTKICEDCPPTPFRGHVTLIKANGNMEEEQDYRLSQICNHNVVTYSIDKDPADMLEGSSVLSLADIINNTLNI